MSDPRIDTSRTAAINVVCGSSGSGKSAYVKQQIQQRKRVTIYDPDDEYAGILKVQSIRELVDYLARYPRGALKIRYVPPAFLSQKQRVELFGLWANAAFSWGSCTAVAEELGGVTTPGKAPGGWHTLVSRGRKRGVEIFAVMQRPAESDKTVMGNATTIRTGRLARASDAAYVGAELGAEAADIQALPDLHFIAKNMRTMEISRGELGGKINA